MITGSTSNAKIVTSRSATTSANRKSIPARV